MTEANCRLDLVGYGESKPLTVGDKYLLICDYDGDFKFTDKSNVKFQDANQKYSIQILALKSASSGHAEWIVTSYRAGEYEFPFTIVDGESVIQTTPLKWTVSSVLDPQTKPELIPSKGPFLVSYPLWLWLTLAAIGLVMASLVAFIFYRRSRKLKLKQELEQYKTMLMPISQFSKDHRLLNRELSDLSRRDKEDAEVVARIIDKIDREFRLYLIRELEVPALQVKDSELLRLIKKQHFVLYEDCASDFLRVFSELKKAKVERDKMTLSDGEDLGLLTRRLAENIFDKKRKSR